MRGQRILIGVLTIVLGFVAGAFPYEAEAQGAVPPIVTQASQLQKGRVVVPSADVYAGPNFDERVIGRVKGGSTWTMSKRVYGAFYQVRIAKNRVGYVTDADIKPLGSSAARATPPRPKPAEKKPERSPSPPEGAHLATGGDQLRRAFDEQNFQGISFTGLRYREQTMGLRPTGNLALLGFKASGTDVLIEGIATELNVQLSPGAPSYYEEATGRGSEGFLFLLDGMILTPRTHGPNTMTFFGFGPLFRFSKFGVTLPVNGKDEFYSLEDMAVGLKFNLGFAQRFGSFATRLDFQYFWEKEQYYGVSLALQFASSNAHLNAPASR